MSLKRMIVIMAFAAAAIPGAAQHAAAQTQSSPMTRPSQLAPPRYAPPRIEIYPRPPLYRRCVDWYELQYRPSGTVLYPQMRCWWVRG